MLVLRTTLVLAILFQLAPSVLAETVVCESFDKPRQEPLVFTWGDAPSAILANAVRPSAGREGSGAAELRYQCPAKLVNNLSYWTYNLAEQVPLVPELESISFQVKSNVPVSIKIGIAPYGFIYHGPGVGPSETWQKVVVTNAYRTLKAWCEEGKQQAEGAFVSGVIVAATPSPNAKVSIAIDDIVLEGSTGAARAVKEEAFRRQVAKVRVAPISLVWDQGNRTLENTLAALDEAGLAGADLACLPQCCVDQQPEPIPGPTAQRIAAKAAQHKMYVVGNLAERNGPQHYVTSFLCDRQGRIVGKYRKSHRLPYEAGPGPGAGFALGDDLVVLPTDFGPIGLTIGTDHYFPEIDTVLARRGARLIVWSTAPFPVRDEHTTTLVIQGRAAQHGVHYAVAQYAGRKGYGGYPDAFSWTATWPLGRAQVFDTDGHTLADSGHAGGVAVATIRAQRLRGSVVNGGFAADGKFGLIAADTQKLPPTLPRKPGMKRTIRAAVIECEGSIDRLIAKLDACGRQTCDIVCLWEYVWYQNDAEVEKFRERNRQWLARIAEAARRHKMYIVIAGELERGFNESVLFDREGKEIGRYTKILQTTTKESKYYREGDRVGIFDLDFGRICTKICLDVAAPEIDRVAALWQVDLMLLSTQDAGPFTEHTRLRDYHRAVDNGYFLLRAACPCAQSDHRTFIMDPWGMVLVGSQFQTDNEPLVATLQLDNRPRYCEWPETARKSASDADPCQRGIAPLAKGDLRAVLIQQRRPELYRPRPEPGKK